MNFLALDFDLTIVDIHTSGRWPGTPEQLAQRIRPFFQTLIPAALSHGSCSCDDVTRDTLRKRFEKVCFALNV